MKKFILILVAVFFSIVGIAQENITELQRVLRATVPTPGMELEIPVSSNSTLLMTSTIGIAWRYGRVLPFSPPSLEPLDLSVPPPDRKFMYLLFPVIRLSYRYFYNFQSRVARNRRVAGNSGDFVSLDFHTTFMDFYRTEGIGPKDFISFSLTPQWGIQRAFGSFHLSCGIGPGLYFDTKGRHGFSWFNLTFRIGFDLTRW